MRFSAIGISYDLPEDAPTQVVEDHTPPKWERHEGELVFYEPFLSDEEAERVSTGEPLVSGTSLRALPAEEVSLITGRHLPFVASEGLRAERGVLFAGEHSPPSPTVVPEDESVVVDLPEGTRRVPPGETAELELEAVTVGLRTFEREVLEEEADNEEGDPNVVHEPRDVGVEVAPTVLVRNYGELAYYTVEDPLEVS